MSIAPIAPVSAVAPTIAPVAAQSPTGGSSFAAQLGRGLETLQAAQDKADNLAVSAATGSLTDVHDYMIASTEASLATKLTVAVRNKALDAFNEIMRMQA
ncbi:MAG: flagellar hook-basal body complex protein FliE [Dactylosporangium sp.]|nr:flagellar hook-basal body complex protein FliE [Dactylosporangium sp.]NNJ61981.1 flagellar hook-basal body complex protein FliE [Dactylosporangium sp.]